MEIEKLQCGLKKSLQKLLYIKLKVWSVLLVCSSVSMICFNDQLNAVRWAEWGSSTRPPPMRSWTFICTVIKPADFLQDKRKKGRGYQAPKFLQQTRSGLLFVSLFSCHCALWRICWTPPHLHHHLFVPLEESGEGGRSHQLSANSRMCSIQLDETDQ